MVESGTAPKDILTNIKLEFPTSNCTDREVYNFITALRRQFLNGRTELEALLDLVSSGEYQYKLWLKEGISVGLFIIYKPAIELVRRFKAVFLMDCTYKTNILQMPFLNIVGITSTYQTFNAGFVFLPDELESSYVWALSQFRSVVVPAAIATDKELALMNAIKNVFPQCVDILCIWHINKNVLANCKKLFEDGESWIAFLQSWRKIVYASNTEIFAEALLKFQDFSSSHPRAFSYISENWLTFKEHFVMFYIKNIRHFGSAATSRVEGNHHVLKSYIKLGRLHILEVVKRLTLLWKN